MRLAHSRFKRKYKVVNKGDKKSRWILKGFLLNDFNVKWAVEEKHNFNLLLSYKCIHTFQLIILLFKIPFQTYECMNGTYIHSLFIISHNIFYDWYCRNKKKCGLRQTPQIHHHHHNIQFLAMSKMVFKCTISQNLPNSTVRKI